MAEDLPDDRASELTPGWLDSVLLRWDRSDEVRVLAGPGAEPLPGGGAAGGTLHVLTSQDPMGEPQPPARNRALLVDLLAWVGGTAHRRPGLRWWPVTGWGVADGHAEQGIGIVGLDRAAACAAGERFRQLAVYELTEDDLLVVRCAGAEVTARAARTWPPGRSAMPSPESVARWTEAYRAAHVAAGLPDPP